MENPFDLNKGFSKESFSDNSLNKLKALPKDEQSSFLIQEFENMLLEIKSPSDYIMDLFVKDLLLEDYSIEKVQYRKRKDISIAYRGALFLMERRFEVFMNSYYYVQANHSR